MIKGNSRLGICLCGESATISDTKAADGRLHFMCQDLTPDGKSKHYGFVDRSEEWRLEAPKDDAEAGESSTETTEAQSYSIPGISGVRW